MHRNEIVTPNKSSPPVATTVSLAEAHFSHPSPPYIPSFGRPLGNTHPAPANPYGLPEESGLTDQSVSHPEQQSALLPSPALRRSPRRALPEENPLSERPQQDHAMDENGVDSDQHDEEDI